MLVVCAGTATEVGKTWVGAATLRSLREAGRSVAARKPAQSFDPADGQPLDSEVLGAATGERPGDVCPPERTYAVPMAPPMAAEVLGLPVPSLADLIGPIRWPDSDVRWLETVGGPRSPLGVDGDAVDAVQALEPDLVVLVADAGLGTINAVRLSLAAFAGLGVPVLVVLNRHDPLQDLHRRNASWLRTGGVDLVTTVDGLVAELERRLAATAR